MVNLDELHRIYDNQNQSGTHNRLQVLTLLGRYAKKMRNTPQDTKSARVSLEEVFLRARVRMRIEVTFCGQKCPHSTEFAVPSRRNGKIFIHWGGDGVVFIRKDQ